MPLINRVGHTVRKLRRQMGLSQEELAERADLHRTYIAGIESGGRNITLRSVEKLALALKISVADMLNENLDLSAAGIESTKKAPDLVDILLIEDNPNDAELTVKALANGNLVNRIFIVRDGQQALDFLFCGGDYADRRGHPLPQLILLDLILPKVSGLEVLQRIRRDPRTEKIAVIVLTVSTSQSDIEECKRLGVEQYISKPVAFKDFCSVIQQLRFSCALLTPEEKDEVLCSQ